MGSHPDGRCGEAAMTDEIDLTEPNDLLIQWDLCEPGERRAWARWRLGGGSAAEGFADCASDRSLRALTEFIFCDCVAFEDYVLLLEEGFLDLQACPFISHVRNAHGEWFKEVRISRQGWMHQGTLRPGGYPDDLLAGAVRGYLARTAGQGIVMGRKLLEVTLDLGDMELLRLAVDPATAKPLLARLPANLPLWEAAPPDDIEAARRERLQWWASDPDRSVRVHDLGLRRGIPPGSIRGDYVTRGADPEEAAAARYSPW